MSNDSADVQDLCAAAERLEAAGHDEYANKLRERAQERMSTTSRVFSHFKSALMWFVIVAAIGLGTGGTVFLAYNANIVGAVATLFVCLIILIIVFVLSATLDTIQEAIERAHNDEVKYR